MPTMYMYMYCNISLLLLISRVHVHVCIFFPSLKGGCTVRYYLYCTGYDTMSATTSPGTRSSSEDPKVLSLKKSPPPPQITLSPLIPVEEHIDPVALIDARIKVV